MFEGDWNHLALVVNRKEGELRHFLNGKLVELMNLLRELTVISI